MPLISLDDLIASTPKNAPSLIGSGLLPEHGLMLLVAKTGVGKSVIASDIAMSLVLQEPLFNAHRKHNEKHGKLAYFPVHQPCKVLYLDTEVGKAGLHQRMRALTDIRCKNIILGRRFEFVTEHVDSLLLMSKNLQDKGIQNLRTLIGDARPEPGLRYVVVFDPLGDFHEMEENDSGMRLVFQRIKKLQHEFGFAAIIPHHESDRIPQGQFGPIERKGTQKSRGHSSITQTMDTVVTLDCMEELNGIADIKIEWPKVRHGAKPVPGILMVDYERMFVKWYGPCKGQGLKDKLIQRTEYIQSLGITPEE